MKVDGRQRKPKKCHYLRSFEDLIKARKLKEFLTLEANTRRQGNVLIEETSNEPVPHAIRIASAVPRRRRARRLLTH